MKLTELQEQARQDLDFELEHVDKYSIKLASLREKWVSRITANEMLVSRAETQLAILYRKWFEHYMTASPFKVDRRDVDSMIDGTEEYAGAKQIIADLKAASKYMDGILKAIDSMSFNIGNAVKWAIFKAGG